MFREKKNRTIEQFWLEKPSKTVESNHQSSAAKANTKKYPKVPTFTRFLKPSKWFHYCPRQSVLTLENLSVKVFSPKSSLSLHWGNLRAFLYNLFKIQAFPKLPWSGDYSPGCFLISPNSYWNVAVRFKRHWNISCSTYLLPKVSI